MERATEHLRQTPWCRALIDDEEWVPTMTWSRVKKVRNTEDTFFAETLGTERTIRRCLTLRPRRENAGDDEPAFKEVRTIMELGGGLNGHPDVAHGGFVATMLDEVMGVLIQLNLERKVKRLRERERGHPGLSCFTAYLNTNYKKPVPTPTTVLCTAKFERQERNKIYVSGSISDGKGTIYTLGDGMFVEVTRTSAHL
ncbi:uncharacterized protein EI97DRAFT_369285 [Westerdykella ornata]|uniref:Thioesterase domain-containing protein n=1 Tax=Westerdykella ornata TaxID=318751 RepID=A0A6A6JWL6_WESOR|nr:uncharacterized protein EI97DRAFT_369285 [Westerdykella ornata]KAF2280208.1 hypothetical protein EI97DRAFT_369285 [Westerdykella ornata]